MSLLRLQRDSGIHERVNECLSRVYVHIQESLVYGVATVSKIDQMIGLFCRILSLL